MEKPVRFTKQMQQELISRFQLCERLVRFGWLPNSPILDLGEDLKVDIYFEGSATHTNFYIQEKSTKGKLKEKRKGGFLVYDDIKVKDLEHWEGATLPVVLVIWDIEFREGRWALVEDVIKELDQSRPKWRENKSKVRVRIPWGNTTDDVGFIRLKRELGWQLYPLISKDKELELQIKANFPNTEEGRAASKAFELSINEGEPITIQGEFIEELRYSQWWMNWFGGFDPKNAQISIGPPESPLTLPAYIDFFSSTGEAVSIPPVELKIIKPGLEISEFSNNHQDMPLHFNIVIPKSKDREGKISVKLNNMGRNIHETQVFLKFLLAYTNGGNLQLSFPTLNNASLTIPIPPKPENSPHPEEMNLINDLCLIQNKIGQFLKIPSEGLTKTDMRTINKLTSIIERGTYEPITDTAIGKFKDKALELILDVYRQGKASHFTIYSPESHIELFDLEIGIGPATQHITGTPALSVIELEKAIAELPTDEHLPIKFVDVEIIEIYPKWFIREAERLSRLLVKNFDAEAVYLFGSLVWSEIHSPDTDIDLAIRGLPPERYLEAIGYLERESKFPVDLVELDKVSEHLRQRIITKGRLLYEREPALTPG